MNLPFSHLTVLERVYESFLLKMVLVCMFYTMQIPKISLKFFLKFLCYSDSYTCLTLSKSSAHLGTFFLLMKSLFLLVFDFFGLSRSGLKFNLAGGWGIESVENFPKSLLFPILLKNPPNSDEDSLSKANLYE